MTAGHPAAGPRMLLGRRDECAVLDRLVAAVLSGRSGVLVVRGEAGVGKTALLEYVVEAASDLRVIRAVGVESEMELAFAGLHQLCSPMLERLERLPAPQRDALRTAFGLSAGPAPDRFFVGLAVLGLLSEVARDRPLLCVIDDAQWLDQASAQALAFVGRRLLAESVVMLFALREPGKEFARLPELVVRGLRVPDARELLRRVVRGPLDERVREQIVAETRGNPLALLELPRGRSPAQLAGGFGLPSALSLPDRIEQSFLERVQALPAETQTLLLVAAAESVGDPGVVWQAAKRIGITMDALEPAARAGLLEIGGQVRFHHPLVRTAAYRSAPLDARQTVHGVLAEVTDPCVDPDRRAWHHAQAAPGFDEEVARELEQSAGRAQSRGGFAASAAFLERAVWLSAEPARRAARALAAAEATHQAGAPDAALGLLATAEAGPLDELGLARVDSLRGQIAYAQNRGSDAPPLLLRAAKRLESLEVPLARETYLDALAAASFAGTAAGEVGLTDVARAVLAAPQPEGQPGPADLLIDGVATQAVHDYAAGVPTLKRALRELRREEISPQAQLRCSLLAYRTAVDLWDDESWYVLATRYVDLARASGALPVLHFALNARIVADAFAGDLAAGFALMEELRAVCEVIGSHVPPYSPLALAAWRGPEPEVSQLIEDTVSESRLRGETQAVSAARWAAAVLNNGVSRYDEALVAATQAVESRDLGYADWSLPELILAAMRCGDRGLAAEALTEFASRADDRGSDWVLGIEARSRALLSAGETADRLYREAIERLRRTRIRPELARAHLHYGEWLRQQRARADAREQLRTAREMFVAMGADVFAEHAERELLASGERPRQRAVAERAELTSQEAEIAQLARDGLSNPEIGARLFLSPRTIEYHLHKVFDKLGIGSRNQLDRALPREANRDVAV